MKHIAVFIGGLLVLISLTAAPAGEKSTPPAIPPRYQPILKTKQARLLEVYGSPEVQPGVGSTAAYSASGKLAVYACNLPTGDDKDPPASQLFVWDLDRGAFQREIKIADRVVTCLALSVDGSQALVGTAKFDPAQPPPSDKQDAKERKAIYQLVLVDLALGKEVRTFGNHKNPVFSLAVSPDGTRALSGSVGEFHYWDLKQGKSIGTLKVPDDKLVAAIAFLPGGTQALAGWDGEVRRWDLAAAKETRAYKTKNPGVAVLGLAVSGDGKRFASADFDYSAALWETDTGKELAAYRRENTTLAPSPTTAQVGLSGDGTTVIACWGGFSPGGPPDSTFVCRFDAATGKAAWSKTAALQGAVPLRLDGKKVVLGGGANPFCEWSVADGAELRNWGGHKGPVTAVAHAGAEAILSAGSEGLVFLSGKDGSQVAAWRAHDTAISALATRKDGKLLTASADHTVKLHDVAKRSALLTLKGHTANVTSVAFGDTDDWAASGSDDRTVNLWDLKDGKKRQILEGHAEGVNAIAISPNGDWLASASNDNTVRLWPIKAGKLDPDRDSAVLDAHNRPVTCVAFSPDGKLLLSGGQDQTVKLWDVAKQEVVRELKGHKNWIGAAIFHGPGRILSASDDLSVCVWDVQNGKELDRIDLSMVADGPRSLALLGDADFAVGTSGWSVLRFQAVK